MKIATSRITQQGQVSVPAEVRRRLGLAPGAVIEWDAEGDKILVRRAGRYSSSDIHAAVFVKPGAWVSLLVLQETLWVLERGYELNRNQQVLVLEMLLEHESVALESPEVVRAALVHFRAATRADFSDCLLVEVARKVGHLP